MQNAAAAEQAKENYINTLIEHAQLQSNKSKTPEQWEQFYKKCEELGKAQRILIKEYGIYYDTEQAAFLPITQQHSDIVNRRFN